MPLPTETTTATVFVVRFWREWSGTEARWRGRIEHVQSGRQANFLAIEGLLRFFQRFGICSEHPSTYVVESKRRPEP